jgi:uncharacterized Zn-binding protein involved in type VI secretion
MKMGDMVIGVDLHTVIIPPAPSPIPMIPHPYIGTIFLWMTPQFPSCTVLIQGVPAAAAGSMGYSAHIPMGLPAPPTMLNQGYWKRYLLNVPKSLMLVAFTMMANMAIAGISAMFVPASSATGKFLKDVTGIDTSSWSTAWTSVKTNFTNYSKWQTWVKLLMPPVPFPAGQGAAAIGSPNVTINGAPLAFAGPLMGTSCSDLPVVPNANPLGFSTVMVGMSFAALVRALAVSMAQAGVNAAVAKTAASVSGKDDRTSTEVAH